MKKIIMALAVVTCYSVCQAQVPVPKTDPTTGVPTAVKDFVKPPAIGDVEGTTNSIVNDLVKKLSLPTGQKPKLTDAITGFLNQKKGILSLANSKPADYLAKFNPMQKGLFSKLKGIMGASAFTKFLGLKPSGGNAAGNILSNLFF